MSDPQIKMDRRGPFLKTVIAIMLIVCAGILVYANSLSGSFIWDDEYLIARNPLIKDPARFAELFRSDPGVSTGKEYGYYRPLFLLSYAADYAAWKLNSVGYHALNLFFHLAAAVLVFFLVRLLFADWLWAWIASLFFVIHPVHTEAVSYISGRQDPLVACWLLITLLCYITLARGRRSVFRFILMIFAFACALLTKENSFILPALILVYHLSFRTPWNRKAFLSLCGVVLAYWIFRSFAYESASVAPRLLTGLWGRVPGFFVAILNYCRLLFLPLDLHMEYGQPRFSWADPRVLAGLALTFGLLGTAFAQKQKRPWIFFSVAWFFAALLPSSNFFPLGFFMTERYLYFPSVGFFILFAKAVREGMERPRARPWVVLAASGLFVFYAALTVIQNTHWKTPLAFYEQNLKFAPESVRLNNEMGRLYDRLGQKEKALGYYRKVIELDPDYPYAYNNIGVILINADKPAEALEWFKKALAKMDAYADAWNNLGNAQLRLGKVREGIEAYQKAVAITPAFAGYRNNLGNAYKASGDFGKARESYLEAIRLDPWDAVNHYNLGVAYLEQKDLVNAKRSLERAAELQPDMGVAHIQLAVAYLLSGEAGKAREQAGEAQKRGIEIPARLRDALNSQ